MNRKAFVYAVAALLAIGVVWLVARPSQQPTAQHEIVLRISHFRPSIPATVQKSRGSLERKLAPLGVAVQWNEFKATPDSLLALSSGAIDVAVGGIEGSIAAIASGIPLQIVATGPHHGSKTGWFTAILVPEGSPIKSLADLKGKKVAVGRGGFSEAVLAVAVRKGGGRYPQDLQAVYLASAEAVGAFTSGVVDAVLTLDPYIPSIQQKVRSRILTDNEQLGYPTIWSVAVSQKFAETHPKIVDAVVDEFLAVGPWVAEHRSEAAASLAKVVGFEPALWQTTLGRASYLLEPPGPSTIPDIQYVADQLLELGVIRKPVRAAEHVRQRNETARR